jgi:hypothetical protein
LQFSCLARKTGREVVLFSGIERQVVQFQMAVFEEFDQLPISFANRAAGRPALIAVSSRRASEWESPVVVPSISHTSLAGAVCGRASLRTAGARICEGDQRSPTVGRIITSDDVQRRSPRITRHLRSYS